MNLTQLKAEAEKAKTSDIELGFWREDISPDDVLRLVEVARAAQSMIEWTRDCEGGLFSRFEIDLFTSLKDIEP